MEIVVYEYNGKPIEKADRIKAKELLQSSMDTIEAEMGKATLDNAKEFHKRMVELVDEPIKAFPISKTYVLKTADALPIIVEELGGHLTLCMEEDKLVGYIAITEEES